MGFVARIASRDGVVGAAFAALALLVARPAAAATATQVTAGDGYECVRTSDSDLRCFGALTGSGVAQVSWPVPGAVASVAGTVASVDAADGHFCIVTTTGGARCLGENLEGELGDGTRSDSLDAPVDVVGLASGVAAISAGIQRTCALRTDGSVACWGDAVFGGELGDGTSNGSTTPVDVVGLGGPVTQVAAGYRHSCAVTASGGVKCWGDNGPQVVLVPTDVAGLTSGVASVASGEFHDCALTTAGGVKCWGDNGAGQLGDGTNDPSATPVNVLGLASGVVAIDATDESTCALLGDGSVRCWGRNDRGQLGDGTRTDRSTPVTVVGVSGAVGVAAGSKSSCALLGDGSVKYWEGGIPFHRDHRVAQNLIDLGPPACALVAPGQIFAARPTPRINLLERQFVDNMTASGEFDLPAGVRFADLDPTAQGVRVQLHVASGVEHTDVGVVGGAFDKTTKVGWKRNASSYTFLGSGVRHIQLVDRGHGAPGGAVLVKLTFGGESFAIAPGEEPVQLTVILGDDAAGQAGRCGQSAFAPGDCTFNEPGDRLKCKK